MTFLTISPIRRSSRLLVAGVFCAFAATALPVSAQDSTPDMTALEWIEQFAGLMQIDIQAEGMDIGNSSMSEADILAAFSGKLAGQADNLRAWTADKITIPHMVLSLTIPEEMAAEMDDDAGKAVGDMTTVTVYEDMVLENISEGRIGSVSFGTATTTATGQTSVLTGGSATDVDVAFVLEWLAGEGGGGEFTPLYRDLYIASQTTRADFPEEGGSFACTIGATSMSLVEARPLNAPINDFVATVEDLVALGEDGEPDAAMLRPLFSFILDAAQSFRSSEAGVEGYDCTVEADGMTFAGSIGTLQIGAYSGNAVYPQFGVSDVAVTIPDGTIALGEAVLKPIDFSGTLKRLQKMQDPADEWAEEYVRDLVPAFDGFMVAALAVDAPNPDDETDRITFGLDLLDITLGNHIGSIPTAINVLLAGLDVQVPQSDPAPGDDPNPLTEFGIEQVSLDFGLDIAWDQATETLSAHQLLLAAENLGTIELSLDLANVSEQMFLASVDDLPMFAMSGRLQQLTVSVDDEGLFDLFITNMAEEEDMPEQAARMAVAGMVGGMVQGILGEPAEALGEAIQDMMQSGEPLTVTFTSRDPAGVPIGQLAMVQEDPTVLLNDLFDVTITE